MAHLRALVALSLPVWLHAMPLTDSNNVYGTMQLIKRNPCDGINASPVLYHEYREADCPAKFKIASDGSCDGAKNPFNNCQAFCQVRTNFVYATEVPFSNTYCHGPLTCTITETKTNTFTINGGLNGRLLDAFSVGASGGFSYAQATATARAFSVKLEAGQCGYFTFVPVRRDICGTMSLYGRRVGWTGVPYCDTTLDQNPIQNIANLCSGSAWKNPDGTADGETIFVHTNCENREPLDMDHQDPVYQKPGVPLDRGALANILNSWQTDACDVSYKFLFDVFEIRGKAWTDNELGVNGEGLEAQIKGCGAVTDWKFEWTPNDPNFEWYASGRLPIGVKNCVGRAVVTAGGPNASKGDCNGSG